MGHVDVHLQGSTAASRHTLLDEDHVGNLCFSVCVYCVVTQESILSHTNRVSGSSLDMDKVVK